MGIETVKYLKFAVCFAFAVMLAVDFPMQDARVVAPADAFFQIVDLVRTLFGVWFSAVNDAVEFDFDWC